MTDVPGEEGLDTAFGITLWGAALLGLVEGLTEFLPVSSTGHLIVVHQLLGGRHSLFEVAIQGGAITAIVVLYRRRIFTALRTLPRAARPGRPNLLVLLAVAALPAAVLGLLVESWIDANLFRPWVVATATVIGGVLLLALEAWYGRADRRQEPLEAIGYRHALWIGVFQCLALIPGTSRSGATIAGALILGYSRTAAAEFSFLLGLPILYGACGLKLWRHWPEVTGRIQPALVLATVVAFFSALLVVGPFVRFLRTHTFTPFAVYRIVAGLAVAGLIAAGVFG